MDGLNEGEVVQLEELHEHTSVEQQAAHAANPAANPLPGKEFIVKPGEPSRLPAGSTLEIAPGLHVPHPHAEVNLPGRGDPRVGETDAVTETLNHAEGTISQRPLPEEVKPKTLTVAEGAAVVQPLEPKLTEVAATGPEVKLTTAQ